VLHSCPYMQPASNGRSHALIPITIINWAESTPWQLS
jgi:hypothetical protein